MVGLVEGRSTLVSRLKASDSLPLIGAGGSLLPPVQKPPPCPSSAGSILLQKIARCLVEHRYVAPGMLPEHAQNPQETAAQDALDGVQCTTKP